MNDRQGYARDDPLSDTCGGLYTLNSIVLSFGADATGGLDGAVEVSCMVDMFEGEEMEAGYRRTRSL